METTYLKLFKNHSEYNVEDTPNVSYCETENEVHYNPWTDPRLIVKYTVEDASNPTQLYFYVSQEGMTIDGATMFDKVEIDGTEVSIADLDSTQGRYQLSDGEHTVSYTLKDPTFIGSEGFETLTKIGAVFAWSTAIVSVQIPNSVTSIGEMAFYGCTGLTSVTIPNSVTTIGNNAFMDCTNLISIEVDSGNTVYDSRNNCNAIIETATNTLIAGCKNTVIPNNVTSIGGMAFTGCTGLTSITIPNSVTSIGNSAFDGCRGLTSITIPNSVTTIGDRAFQGCTGLTSITIPNGVTTIGQFAFVSCTGLTSVIVQAATPPTLGSGVFNNNASGRKIYVPSASVAAYKAATNWSTYANDIEAIS